MTSFDVWEVARGGNPGRHMENILESAFSLLRSFTCNFQIIVGLRCPVNIISKREAVVLPGPRWHLA